VETPAPPELEPEPLPLAEPNPNAEVPLEELFVCVAEGCFGAAEPNANAPKGFELGAGVVSALDEEGAAANAKGFEGAEAAEGLENENAGA
jgi:hypothetical protein